MEYWDIYDKDRNLTGRTMKRNDFTMKDGDYHLTVLGVICRPDGKFLITQRALDKHWAPGWWEVSGGGVMAGETSEQAVIRELLEETGLDVSNAEGGYQFSYHRESPGDNYFVDIYKFILDFDESQVTPQLAEMQGYMLADKAQIEEFAKQGIFLHYDSIKQVFES
ncbi:MAG: NUDIX domain-containing protein [Oscillospiraceae bacterium]|nr:NUDIX domain-containing protein [Oscillospiraceae bacterium]